PAWAPPVNSQTATRSNNDGASPTTLRSACEGEGEPQPETRTEPYRFASAFPAEHFVSHFIAYAAQRTDAAHEYHEATALILLASATPNVRAPLAQYADGLPTNLYLIIIGDTTKSRKSTSKNIGRDLQHCVIPDSLLADQASPEAFIEQL